MVTSDFSDLTREQLISNILKYKLDLIKHLSAGTFSVHPLEVLANLDNCLALKATGK